MNNNLEIRSATTADVPKIYEFICALADYEKLRHCVVADEQKLTATLFGERAYAEVVIAQWQGQPVGFALFFHNYSTFLAKPGIYLEDLFVLPTHRGYGIGKRLLEHLAALAIERDCGRLDWSVLDWNQPAIDFYRSVGAKMLDDWRIFRLDGDALRALGKSPA